MYGGAITGLLVLGLALFSARAAGILRNARRHGWRRRKIFLEVLFELLMVAALCALGATAVWLLFRYLRILETHE